MKKLNIMKVLWASVSVLWLLILLWFLRQFDILGSEYSILINWVSAIGLILLGVFIGTFILEKKIQIRLPITFFFIFIAGFFAAPFIAVCVLVLTTHFSLSKGIEPLIFGGSITCYLLIYILFWLWLKKKCIVKLG